jgi:hypothetical protein
MTAPAGGGPPSGEGATIIGAAPAAGTIPDYGANVPTGPSATTPPYGSPVVPGGPPPPPGGPGGPGGPGSKPKSKLPLIAGITAAAIAVVAIGGFLATRGGGEPTPSPSRTTTASPTGSSTSPSPVVDAPGAPVGLDGRVISQTEVLVFWQAPASGADVDLFEIFRDSTSIGEVDGDTFSFSDTSVEADTDYSYTVQSVGADGQRSDMSDAFQASTPAPDVTPEEELLTHIPEAIRDSCVDPDSPPNNATASKVCSADGDNVTVWYSLYDNQADMTTDYEEFTSDRDYKDTPNNCSDDGFGQYRWNYENDDPGGERSCYLDSDDQAWVEWTEENLLIYSFALRSDGDYAALSDWWASADSGPI